MPVAEFSGIMRDFTALAKAPSDEIASPAKIEWIIDGLQASIALATVKGVSTEPDVVEKAVSAYAPARSTTQAGALHHNRPSSR